ncbi:MAG: hypothetical protein WAX66_00560 [Patescibacteria group bacterium]
MEKRMNVKGIKRNIFLIALWIIFLIASLLLCRVYIADIYFKKSQVLLKIGDGEDSLLYANKSVSLNPFEPNYYRGRAKVNTVRLVSIDSTGDMKEFILFDLQRALDLNPSNLVTIRNSIPLYYFLAVKDLNTGSGVGNIDEGYISYTKEFFRNTKNSYWNDAGVISSVAKYEKKLGLVDEYEESVERIKELRPDLLEWNDSFR